TPCRECPPATRGDTATRTTSSRSSFLRMRRARCSMRSSPSRRSCLSSNVRTGARSASRSTESPSRLSCRRPPRSERQSSAPPGPQETAAGLEPCPEGGDERGVSEALGTPWCPRDPGEPPSGDLPPPLVELSEIRGDLHCHTTWSDGSASVEEMALAAIERGYEYLAICDHTPAVGVVRGLTADDLRRQAVEIANVNHPLPPIPALRGPEC